MDLRLESVSEGTIDMGIERENHRVNMRTAACERKTQAKNNSQLEFPFAMESQEAL